MAHTTIKVESVVRDRLATLAAENGTSIAQLVSDFAAHTPTESERAERTARTLAVLREMSGYTQTLSRTVRQTPNWPADSAT